MDYLIANLIEIAKNEDKNIFSFGICTEDEGKKLNFGLSRFKEGFGIGIGNPIHYKKSDFIVIKIDFDLPKREFDIGYITSSKNKLIEKFIQYIK